MSSSEVYNDLGHPPPTSIGRHAWRMADGSYNNINLPEMGKVGCADVFDYNVNRDIRLVPHILAQFSNLTPFQKINCLILGLSLTRTFTAIPSQSRYQSHHVTML
jgi:hypothetical protein